MTNYKPILYISSKPTGNHAEIEQIARGMGWTTINSGNLSDMLPSASALPIRLMMLEAADAIYIDESFTNTSVCATEVSYAKTQGIPIIYNFDGLLKEYNEYYD